jgi:hypothetical protein
MIEKNENKEIDNNNEENKETQACLLAERRASKKKNRLKTIFNMQTKNMRLSRQDIDEHKVYEKLTTTVNTELIKRRLTSDDSADCRKIDSERQVTIINEILQQVNVNENSNIRSAAIFFIKD